MHRFYSTLLEWKWRRLSVVRGADHIISEKSQWTQNGTMFVDLDWPLNASSPLSASAELLVFRKMISASSLTPRNATITHYWHVQVYYKLQLWQSYYNVTGGWCGFVYIVMWEEWVWVSWKFAWVAFRYYLRTSRKCSGIVSRLSAMVYWQATSDRELVQWIPIPHKVIGISAGISISGRISISGLNSVFGTVFTPRPSRARDLATMA